MGFLSANTFPVKGRTVLITGGSRGMGLEVGRQLAEKGASVVIIARDVQKLQDGIKYISEGAANTQAQRFLHISADMTSPEESIRVISEVTTWNSGNPPDIVWCCAGSSYPTLFIDTPVEKFKEQMDSNYLSSVYMAHAAMSAWLRPNHNPRKTGSSKEQSTSTPTSLPARHLIFTASFLSFYTFTGYSPYSPTKAALRSLSDSLSQEMNLYAAANPKAPRVQVHTIFPATIFTESYEAENKIKPDVTKLLEDGDEGQTAAVVAKESIKGLENGHELVTTTLLTRLVMCSVLGGSARGGFFKGWLDWIASCLMGLVMLFVRGDMNSKVKKWGKKYGDSGMKEVERS